MHSTIRNLMIAAAVLACGCDLDDSDKDTCVLPTDCVDGFVCVNQTCIGDSELGPDGEMPDPNGPTPDAGIDDPIEGGGGDEFEYGEVASLVIQRSGVAAVDGHTLIGVTTASGGLGCALLANESAAPGAPEALVYTKIDEQSGDARCPDGFHALTNFPEFCEDDWPLGSVRPGCGLYKRWDASGQQVANRLPTGGYVSVQSVYLSEMHYRCDVELSISFSGGVTVQDTFSFDYNPFAPDDSFCVP